MIHPLNVVPKASGGFRLILDCRYINGFLPDIGFRMENLDAVPLVVEEGDFMFTTDLADAYYHLPIHPTSQPYLCFEWRKAVYACTSLPFGLGLAPFLFTRLTRPLVSFCRHLGVSVLSYLDDFLFAGSLEKIEGLRDFVLWLLAQLGFTVSLKKSALIPSQLVRFLGLLFSSKEFRYFVPPDKLEKVQKAFNEAAKLAVAGKAIPVRQLARLAGLLISLRLAVAPARVMSRALYSQIENTRTWADKVVPSEACTQELTFWATALSRFNGRSAVARPASARLRTDASDLGWGAWIEGSDIQAFGAFPPDWQVEKKSSTFRELAAVLFALKSDPINQALSHQRVALVLDSTAAVGNLANGGGPVPELCILTRQIWEECVAFGIDASAVWARRDTNSRADTLSRTAELAEWSLSASSRLRIQEKFGTPSVDRFATSRNTVVPRFNSKFFDPLAEATDAFSQNWEQDLNLCVPEWAEVPRVLFHAARCKARLILVVPVWKSQPWWAAVESATEDSVSLGKLAVAITLGPLSPLVSSTTPSWEFTAVLMDFSRESPLAVLPLPTPAL